MELICINDKYPEEFLKVFLKHEIRYPKENEIVTLVGWEKLPRVNKTGFYVEPYTKQFIPGEIMGITGEKEVSFDSKRFTTLLGEEVTEEQLQEIKNEEKLVVKSPKIDKHKCN